MKTLRNISRVVRDKRKRAARDETQICGGKQNQKQEARSDERNKLWMENEERQRAGLRSFGMRVVGFELILCTVCRTDSLRRTDWTLRHIFDHVLRRAREEATETTLLYSRLGNNQCLS